MELICRNFGIQTNKYVFSSLCFKGSRLSKNWRVKTTTKILKLNLILAIRGAILTLFNHLFDSPFSFEAFEKNSLEPYPQIDILLRNLI